MNSAVITGGAWDRDETSARWGSQFSVLASAKCPSVPHKVSNELVDLFVVTVAHEFLLLMQQQEDRFLAA